MAALTANCDNCLYFVVVIEQYMTFPIHAPERISLTPVLAMLLQFNLKEREEVEKAARDPTAAGRPVKEIKRSLHKASSSSSSLSLSSTSSHGNRSSPSVVVQSSTHVDTPSSESTYTPPSFVTETSPEQQFPNSSAASVSQTC